MDGQANATGLGEQFAHIWGAHFSRCWGFFHMKHHSWRVEDKVAKKTDCVDIEMITTGSQLPQTA